MNDGRSKKISQSLEYADSLFKARDYDNAREVYLAAAQTAIKAKDQSSLTECYAMIARCCLICDKKQEGGVWLEKSTEIARPEFRLGWSRYLGVRGRFEWQDNQIEKATETFKEMYAFCSVNHLHDRAVDAAHMIAITGTPQEQVEWGLKGIREAEEGNLTSWLGPLWNNLGATYEDLKEFAKSLDAYVRAREYHYKFGDKKNRLVADYAVAHARRNLGEYETALKSFEMLQKNFAELGDTEFQGLTAREIGEIHKAQGQGKEALTNFEAAAEFLSEAGMAEWDSAGFSHLQNLISELKAELDR